MKKKKEVYCEQLRGRTIKDVRAMTAEEIKMFGWYDNGTAVVLLLDNEMAIIPSRDPEGNGPGFLFVEKTKKM